MGNAIDNFSATALRLLDALLLRNPERTAIGGLLGLSIHGVVGVLRPVLVVLPSNHPANFFHS